RHMGAPARHGDAGPRRGPHPAGARERSVNRPPVGRLLVLLTVMVFGLTGVMARLSVLQVREGTSYEERGYDQRLHTFILTAQSGAILDASRQALGLLVGGRAR